jgi:hypothetical protein
VPGVLGEFDPTLDALVSPIQPEQERIVKKRSQRAPEGMALPSKEFAGIADSRSPQIDFIE